MAKWVKKCDKIFSELIKHRDQWKCVETGTTNNLQTAHVISRSYKAIRWDMDNAVCLSAKRHMYYTHHPIEWRTFCIKHLGRKKYEALETQAMKHKPWGEKGLKDLYAELADKLTTIRYSGDR